MERFTDISIRNYSYVFDFEKEFVFQDKKVWMQQNWTDAYYYIVVYLCIIFGTKYYMQDKPPFKLRLPLVLWNLGLAAFSIFAFARTVPEFIHIISNHGFYHSVCSTSFVVLDRVSGCWGWLCAVSKVVELGDTVFIVLRKKPLIFLHWYHHILTLWVVWYSFTEVLPTARWFMVMNTFVHSIMYSYYALKAMGYRLPRQISMSITILQLSQMFIATGINIYVYTLLNNNDPCPISYKFMRSVFIMYMSYVILFANLFYQSYVSKKNKGRMQSKSKYLHSSKSKAC